MSRTRVTIGLVFASALALLSCSAPKAPPPSTTPVFPKPAAPPPVDRPVAAAPQTPDQCKSAELKYLIGKPRSEIPVPADPSRRRVACTTCPVTMDYNPERLNIFFDADTGIIKDVKCG
jgi:hypothetical protein